MIGAPILLVSAGLVVFSHRVLASFFLDVVVQTIKKESDPPLEPYDFPWGTMHWGRSAEDFTYLCAGLLFLALAQLLVGPPIIQRLNSAGPETRNPIPKLAMVFSFVATLIAAVSFLFIALITKSAFSTLSVSGGVDPISLAGDLPFLSTRIFMISLVTAQILLIIAIFTLPKNNPVTAPKGNVLTIASCTCFFLFALLMIAARLGPIHALNEAIESSMMEDPFKLAGHVTMLIHLYFVGALLLATSAILSGIASLSAPKSDLNP